MTVTQGVYHVMLYAPYDEIQLTLPPHSAMSWYFNINRKTKSKVFQRSELSFSIWLAITLSEILRVLVRTKRLKDFF